MLSRDILALLTSGATVAQKIALVVLLGGLVSGVVASGVMQTEIRAWLHKRAFARYFAPSTVSIAPESGVAAHSPDPYLTAFADKLGSPFFGLHYRQLAGQLLAYITQESRHAADPNSASAPIPSALTQPIIMTAPPAPSASRTPLIDTILRLKSPPAEPDDGPAVSIGEKFEACVRWIDLLQAALGRAIVRAILFGTAAIWSALLAISLLEAGTDSSVLRALIEAPTVLDGVGAAFGVAMFFIAAVLIVLPLAWAIAAAGLVVFTILDRVAGAK